MTENSLNAPSAYDLPYGASGRGFAPGSTILTLDGAMPVEQVLPGDRIITRNGARALRAIHRVALPQGAPLVSLSKAALGGRPERDMWMLPDQPILIRDWRAQALWGVDQAQVPVKRLIDGTFLRWMTAPADTAYLQLTFGSAEILYVDGLELASADQLVATA